MANQIATFFASQPGDIQAEEVAAHLKAFWEPRMLTALLAHADAGGAGLSPLALRAVERLRVPTA
nr:formate dehydrogenase subunit delta [Rubellimicrobium aerolatum]